MLIAGEPDVDNITSPCVARVNRARRPTHIAPSPAQTRDPYHPDSSPPLSPDGPCSSQLTGSSEDRHTSIGPWQRNWSRSQHLSQHRDTLPVPIAGSGAESSADLATRRIPTVGRYVLDWVGGVQDYQVATVIGIIAGYLVAWALSGTESWRWMLGMAAIPGTLIFFLLLRLPDTARWYMMRGRRADAERVLAQVEPGSDIKADLDDMEAALSEEQQGKRGILSLIGEMLRKPFLRATVFVVGLGFFVQITGINAIVYYSPRIFEAMGFQGNFALLGLPALVQVAGLAAVFVSLILVDRMGRRPILLTGIGIMILANVLLVAVFSIGSEFGGALTALGFLGLLLFTVGFTFGFGALVWVYAGESFPARLRSLGSSAMLTSDLVANVAVAAIFLTLLTRLGGAGTFIVFGVLAVAAFAFVFKLAPETKGRHLEEIRHYWENGGKWPTASVAATTEQSDKIAAGASVR